MSKAVHAYCCPWCPAGWPRGGFGRCPRCQRYGHARRIIPAYALGDAPAPNGDGGSPTGARRARVVGHIGRKRDP